MQPKLSGHGTVPVLANSSSSPTTEKKEPCKSIEQTTRRNTRKASLSGSVIDTVTKIEILRTVSVEGHHHDTPLTFHNTLLFSLFILLVHASKFNVMTLL